MIVKSINARRSRKQGRVTITFEVAAQTWMNMRRAAKEGAHPEALDYIAARINTAFLEDAPPQRRRRRARKGDMDDDLPF